MMSVGAGESLNNLRLVQTPGQAPAAEIISDSNNEEGAALKKFSSADPRSKEEIRNAALENIQSRVILVSALKSLGRRLDLGLSVE